MKENIAEGEIQLSKIIAGVMNWGVWGADLNTTSMAALIDSCLELGVSTFDHADIYGGYTTEEAFGKAFKASGVQREKIELISKFGIVYPTDNSKVKAYNTTSEYIIQQVEQSLKNLQCDYLDVLLLHRPSPIMDARQIADTVDHLKESGKIKAFGVSNFTATQMELLSRHTPLCTNQVEASLLHLDPYLDGTFDCCQKLNIHPLIWSPLAGAILFTTSNKSSFLEQRDRILTVCNTYGWTLDQAAYLFLLHHPFRLFPITGSSKLNRIKLAVDCLNQSISSDQFFELWTASTGVKVP